ncbi:MAG: MauE/DoxX family redox-associated membrane protein [Pedobacter sp.]|jgi:uncharacterized membrane protein YphA (DoxX/SURF4 family)|uniref:MauE/DoxX family redox-associated membrane protein n=1 Tax=Pedobacter sp. TaxID=1411316 RepID=UPI0035656E7C
MDDRHVNNRFSSFNFRGIINQQVIVTIISGLFFLLFIHTATDKLIDFQKFNVQLGQSPLLTPISRYVAWFIPSVEILISFLLVFPFTRLIALYASHGLMVMFTTYIIVIMNFTERIPCSCGGIFEGMKWGEHLIVNIAFVGVGIVVILLQTRINKQKRQLIAI